MSERKLASVQKIKSIEPIENRDKIQISHVLGWSVITGKDMQPGDLVVYVEIDSCLPDRPEFSEVRKRGSRIRTMKMANHYSEGICFPLSILPNGDWKEGDDVTQLLGITKYDEYAGDDMPCRQVVKKNKYSKWQLFWYKIFGFPKKKDNEFSNLISKTDEVRIQNIPQALQNKTPISVSEKIDGQSTSYTLERSFWGNKFNVYSRNLRVEKDNSTYWRIAEMYDIEDRMGFMIDELDTDWIAIQGEIAGPGIQKNPLKLDEIEFFVFNIITPKGRLGNKEMAELCYRYGFGTVPMISFDYTLPDTVDEILNFATSNSLVNPDVLREGIVCRSQDGSQSFKAVSPEYLIKHNK